ncbi:DUF5996 family protein [Streptomyces hoynatensis]|uniref:Ava_C0101 and related proteins n=1 Tax=Streptomyces hoynatensis TaxID=1141874 RepID=A0A3A9YVM8_9ACTN|nr:DUF5996 family protein [Streptomyces hoynatensis]RKN40108.1 hypothetical protein D7294_19575 [Streptomyces hoynatensis]
MEVFPPIPLAQWRDSKETLHRFAQVIGKIRLASSVRRNHWWNVPYHVTGRGITTRPMGQVDGNPIFTVDFDFVDHLLIVREIDGRSASFSLLGQSVASFYREALDALRSVGVEPTIEHAHPFGLGDEGRPFAEDTEHASYDPYWVNRYWQVLSQVNLVLEEFAAGFSGKISPVHHFWHTFDIAVTRFEDRPVDQPPQADPVTREAYSRAVISSGFWFGDEAVPRPTFYSYAAPEPEGLAERRLSPATARWMEHDGSHMATLDYDAARETADPRRTVLGFFESVYRSAAGLADWDVRGLASPEGVTDPREARAA